VRVDRQHLGVDADHPARLGHRRRGQRAHPAQVLGEHEVGSRGGEGRAVELVERQAAGGPVAHPRVDLGGREVGGQRGVDDDRAPPTLRALERDRDEALGQAQRHHDLGGGGQQRGDPHPSRLGPRRCG
jgi:hypothetical protein